MSSKIKYLMLLISGVITVFLLIHVVSILPKNEKQIVSPLATDLMNTNKYLLENDVKLQGEVIFEGKGQIKFAGTQISANLYNDNNGSTISYESKIPFETIRYIVNQISPMITNENLDHFVIFKDDKNWRINSIGNSLESRVSLESKFIMPFLKGNEQYLENGSNLSNLSYKLSSYNETGLKQGVLSPHKRNKGELGFHIQIPTKAFIAKEISTKMGIPNNIDVSFITDNHSNVIKRFEFRIPLTRISTQPISNSELSGTGNVYVTYDLKRSNK